LHKIQYVGLILLFIGLLFFTNIMPLATVVFPKYFWYQLYPDGTVDNPTIITSGDAITLTAKLVYYDATDNVELPSPYYWKVTVTIEGVTTIDFGHYKSVQGGVKIDNHYCAIAIWEKSWTIPTGEGVTYKFTWNAKIYDKEGVLHGETSKTTYAKTPSEEPDGVFKVNGYDATEMTSLVVFSNALQFEFDATKNPDKITRVYVEVWKGSLINTVSLEKKTTSHYEGTYTLPASGTYELKGYITWSGGTFRKMSITAGWGEEEQPPFAFGTNQLIGAIMMFFGVIMLASPYISRKR